MVRRRIKGDIQKTIYFLLCSFIILTNSISVYAQYKEEELGTNTQQLLVSNIFSQTDIRQALKDIAIQCGVNIIPDNTVQGMVTLEVQNVPLEKCLKMLLAPGGYVFKKVQDYYLVGLPKPQNPAFRNLCSIEYIGLKYLTPRAAIKMLPKMFSRYVRAGTERNILIITAPEDIIEEIKKCIHKIDIPPKQIMIEAIVTEVSHKAMKRLGIDWSYEWNNTSGVYSESYGRLSFQDVIGKVSYSLAGEITRNIKATLKFLIDQGEAKIRANPKIIAQDGKEASIYIGKEKYYSISATNHSSYARLEMIRSGITLKIKPRINNDDEITVKIEPEVSDVNGGEETMDQLPLINNRKARTTVRVKNGETIVIGGLLQQNKRKVVSRVPILSRIPLINLFFQNKSSVVSENELIILITPYILEEKDKGVNKGKGNNEYQGRMFHQNRCNTRIFKEEKGNNTIEDDISSAKWVEIATTYQRVARELEKIGDKESAEKHWRLAIDAWRKAGMDGELEKRLKEPDVVRKGMKEIQPIAALKSCPKIHK
jgi:type IV pilus assembly protein PilQ